MGQKTAKAATVVSKIRKLLALAEGSEGNEAEVAAKMADNLMRKHAVSLSHLEEDEIREADPLGVHAFEVGSTTWAIRLAWALAKHCNVSAIRSSQFTNRHPTKKGDDGYGLELGGGYKTRTWAIGYGHRSDLEVWDYLFTVARREIQKAAKAHRAILRERAYKWGHEVSRTDMTRFREGAVVGLRRTLFEQRTSSESTQCSTTALAVQSRAQRARAEMTEKNPRLTPYRGGVGACPTGIGAGMNIQLNKGIRGGGPCKEISG